jgi:hypothetical protein
VGLAAFSILADDPRAGSVINLTLRARQNLHPPKGHLFAHRELADIAFDRFIAAFKSPLQPEILKNAPGAQAELDSLANVLIVRRTQALPPGGRKGTL